MKYFRMSYREVVFERSYINLLLLNRAIPGMKPFDEDKDDEGVTHHRHANKERTKAETEHANSFFERLM